jgi:hypothetical protein
VVSALLVGALLLHALWAGSATVPAADLWWAMAAGRFIVEQGTIPERDVFSFTHPGAVWINGEWLSQVLFFELHRLGGGSAVAAFKLALVVVVFALIAWLGWRRSGSLALAVCTALLAAYVCRPFLDIRSQLFLFLCAPATIAVLELYRRGASSWVLALLPPIMVVWVNSHYSFLFGAGLLLLSAGGEAAKSWLRLPEHPMARERALRLAGAAVVAVLAALINPYGVRAFTHPFTIVGGEALWRDTIIEWLPPALFVDEEFNPALFGYVLILQLVAAAAALGFDRRRVDLSDGLLVAVTAAMALSARRFVPLFALVSAPFLATNLAVLRDRLLPRLAPATSAAAGGLVAVGLTALLIVRALPDARQIRERGLFDTLVDIDYFPVGAAEFLRHNPLPVQLFHAYTWGGYLLFQLPDHKIFIDGRAHTVYPFEFMAEQQAAERGEPQWSEVLDRWNVSLVVWPSGIAHEMYAATSQHLAESRRWLRIYDDRQAAVFAHLDRAAAWIERFYRAELVYPEVADAQLFLFRTYMKRNDLVRAGALAARMVSRFPQTRASMRKAEEGALAAAETRRSPPAWFALGFYREINGDDAGAGAAFREALGLGLEEPKARSYAEAALRRLSAND